MLPRSSTRQAVGLAAGLAVALLVALPHQATATPESPDDGCLTDEVCRGHYEQAVALFEQGRFEAALPEFQAAYAHRQMPWLLINLGRTLHRLGRPREALEKYERYSKAEPRMDAEKRKLLDKYIAQAQALVDSPSAGPPPGGALPRPEEARQAPHGDDKPLYKKWWLWTAVGGAAAVVVIGVAVGVGTRSSSSLPSDVMVYRPGF